MKSEEIVFQRREYRMQGGEIHRRPIDREGMSVVYASWLVLTPEEVPPEVKRHFAQARA